MRRVLLGVAVAGIVGANPGIWVSPQGGASDQPQAIFKAAVEAVTVSAAVRDARGRVMQGLKASDFQIFDTGNPVQISDFYVGESPISLAILIDISGSMAVGGNMGRA